MGTFLNPKYSYRIDSELVPWGKDEIGPFAGIEKKIKLDAYLLVWLNN